MFNVLHGKCDVFFMVDVRVVGGCYVFQGGGVRLVLTIVPVFYNCALGVSLVQEVVVGLVVVG